MDAQATLGRHRGKLSVCRHLPIVSRSYEASSGGDTLWAGRDGPPRLRMVLAFGELGSQPAIADSRRRESASGKKWAVPGCQGQVCGHV